MSLQNWGICIRLCVFEEIQCIQPKLFKTMLWSVSAQRGGNILEKVKTANHRFTFHCCWCMMWCTTKVQWCIQQTCAIVHDDQLCLKQQRKKIHCGATVEKGHCGARPEKLQHSALDQKVGAVHLLLSLSVKTEMATRSESIVCTM